MSMKWIQKSENSFSLNRNGLIRGHIFETETGLDM